MTSTASTRLRLDKQATGDNPDAWGTRLNAVIDLVDEAFGFAEIAVNGSVTLTTANFTSDQARRSILRFTGAGGFAVTVPTVEKWYFIDNRCAADVTLRTASTSGSTVVAGTKRIAYCDGANITTDTSSVAPSASAVAFNPSGSLASTNVQAALNELDGDVQTSLRFDCQLVFSNSTTITLARFGGSRLFVNGVHVTIPSGGVTLSSAPLVAGTVYWIYAQVVSGVLSLYSSTVASGVDATYGHRILPGSPDLTFVGGVYIATNAVFVDAPTSRHVVSYYNRPIRSLVGAPTVGSTASTSYVEVAPGARVSFVAFAGDVVDVSTVGYSVCATASTGMQTAIGIDSATTPVGPRGYTVQGVANAHQSIPVRAAASPTYDGLHYAAGLASVTVANSATWEIALVGTVR